MSGTTRDILLKKIVEDEEFEDKKGAIYGSDSHKSTHQRTRQDQVDYEKKVKEEEEKKEEDKKGDVKYTVAYTKWVESTYQKDIKAGTPIGTIQADAKVQQTYSKSSGQSPIAK